MDTYLMVYQCHALIPKLITYNYLNLAFRFLLLKGPAMAWCQAHGPFIVHKTNIPL